MQDVVDAIVEHFPNVEMGYTEAEQLNQLSYIVSDEKIRNEGFETAYTLDQGVAKLVDKFRALIQHWKSATEVGYSFPSTAEPVDAYEWLLELLSTADRYDSRAASQSVCTY